MGFAVKYIAHDLTVLGESSLGISKFNGSSMS